MRPGFSKKEQDEEDHGEDAESCDAKDILYAKFGVRPIGDHRAEGAANIDHGVVNGIADGTNVFLGRARGGADHTGFDQSDAERRQKEHDANEYSERHGIADRAEPRRADGAEKEICAAQDEVGEGKSAPKAEPVRDGAAEDGKKPDGTSKNAGQGAGLLGGEVELFMEIQGERGKGAVVGEALEDFADVGDPEGGLESVVNLLEALAEGHARGMIAEKEGIGHRGTGTQRRDG